MSEQDKSLLDEQAALVRAVYRALPEEEIPTEIEARILANAAAAIKPNSTRRWLQWSAPLASAAAVLLVVGIVMQPQSQREMIPDAAVMIDSREAAPPPVVSPAPAPPDASAPRRMAQKPDLSTKPQVLEDARVRSSRPSSAAKREESESAAFQPPARMAEERRERQEERGPMMPAPSAQIRAETDAADSSSLASTPPAANLENRSTFMRTEPQVMAPMEVNVVNPALDISPALLARLEQLLSTRQQARASAGDSSSEASLEQLRREYPGVDIDAALRALEQMRLEGGQ